MHPLSNLVEINTVRGLIPTTFHQFATDLLDSRVGNSAIEHDQRIYFVVSHRYTSLERQYVGYVLDLSTAEVSPLTARYPSSKTAWAAIDKFIEELSV